MKYDVDLLQQAIGAVREETDQRDEPEFRFDVYNHKFQEVALPKPLSHRVARQVLLLSGRKPKAKAGVGPISRESVEERAAHLLGLEDAEVLFGEENSLRDIERYREQMEDGDEPYGAPVDVLL